MNPNEKQNAVEECSIGGMDAKKMAEKIRKLKAELQQNKDANSNQFGNPSMMMQMSWQMGIQIGELKKEIDGMKATNRVDFQEFEGMKEEMVKMKEEFKKVNKELGKVGEENAELKEKLAKLNEEFEEIKAENKDLKEKVGKLGEENVELNDKMAKVDKKFTEKIDKFEGFIDEQTRELNKSMAKMIKDRAEEMGKLDEMAKGMSEIEAKNAILEGKMVEKNEEMARMNAEIQSFVEENVKFECKVCELLEQKADKEMLAKLTKRIDGMDFVQKNNNKWNKADSGPELSISDDGFAVKHSGANGCNSIRAVYPTSQFNLYADKPSIVAYFEVLIVGMNQAFGGIQIGFCTQQYPRGANWFVNVKNSIWICSKHKMLINGQTKKFGNDYGNFITGDLIGLGIGHFPANSPVKCFATRNGRLLGTVKLPADFADLVLFPAVTLHASSDSIRANFGQEKWRFEPSQLLE